MDIPPNAFDWMTQSSAADEVVNLFDSIWSSITASNERNSFSNGSNLLNIETNSVIFGYLRHCSALYWGMSFESICELCSACAEYAVGGEVGTSHYALHNPQLLDLEFEKNIQIMNKDVRQREAILSEMVSQLAQLDETKTKERGKSALLGEAEASFALKNEEKCLDSYLAFSDKPEDTSMPRTGGKAGNLDETFARLPSAAINTAIAYARSGHMEAAMKAVGESMRVSQQTSNDQLLLYSMAVLCQLMERSLPGVVELQGSLVPGCTLAEMHYLELEILLKRCYTRGEVQGIPNLTSYARLSLARLSLMHPAKETSLRKDFAFENEKTLENLTKFLSRNTRSGFVQPETSCFAATNSLDCMLYSTRLAYETTSLASCPAASRAFPDAKSVIEVFPTPPAAGKHEICVADAATAMEITRGCKTALLLRASGWQVWGSQRLALNESLVCLESDSKQEGVDVAALSLILLNAFHRYGFEVTDKILQMPEFRGIKDDTLTRTVNIIKQRRAVYHRNTRKALELAAHIGISPKVSTIESVEHKVEVRESLALAYLYGSFYAEADKAAYTGYILAKNAYLPLVALRLLLLRGRIHLESGSWETSVEYVCSVLEQSREMHADLLGAEAAVYLGKIWMKSKHLQRAKEEIESALPVILGHGDASIRGRACLYRVEVELALTRAAPQQHAEEYVY